MTRVTVAVLLFALAVPGVASAARARFAVTARVTIELAWQDRLSYTSGGCGVTALNVGSQRFDFRSAAPTRVGLIARKGRLQRLAGRVGLAVSGEYAGTTTVTSCGQTTTSPCELAAPTTLGASVRFARYRRGVLQLSQLVSGFTPWQACLPQSLAEPTYPLPGGVYGAVAERTLLKRRTTVVTAERELVTRVVVPGEEQGTLMKRVSWTLTFKRLGR